MSPLSRASASQAASTTAPSTASPTAASITPSTTSLTTPKTAAPSTAPAERTSAPQTAAPSATPPARTPATRPSSTEPHAASPDSLPQSHSWTGAFGRACAVLLQAIVNGLALTRISPNALTFIGLIINTVAAVLFGYASEHNFVRMFLYAGLVLIGAGIFDMVDGRVARLTNKVTLFGAFFDSVMDRYSDVAIFFGLLVYYARGNRFFYVVLVAFVMVTSLLVSYTRARAEALIGKCKVGFMERPERVVLVIIGALFSRWGVMAPVLWTLAVLSTITVIHRIRYTYEITKSLTTP